MNPFEKGGAREFLSHTWQRAPALFEGALPTLPALPDWRALAARDDVESRRVQEPETGRFRLEHGPFDPAQHPAFDAYPWTILIQDADSHSPTLATLLEHFDFLPHWRLEDIMLSFAVTGGSVGPHVDQYDVFLIQARGTRHWQVGRKDSWVSAEDGGDLRLVEPFSADFECVARPGDVLYLPPGVPHHGVARDECTTLSVGFRAPDQRELLGILIEELGRAERFADPDRGVSPHPGELDSASVDTAARLLREALTTDEALAARCLGRLVTEPKDWLLPEPAEESPTDLPSAAGEGRTLAVSPGSRMAHSPEHGLLFVNGEVFELSPQCAAIAAELSNAGCLDGDALRRTVGLADARTLIEQLLASGSVYFES